MDIRNKEAVEKILDESIATDLIIDGNDELQNTIDKLNAIGETKIASKIHL